MTEAPALERLDPSRYRRTPWKNGKGVSVDIAGAYRNAAEPGGWSGIVWRLGRTRVEAPGPFSDLAGYDRILALIEGGGLVLRPQGRPEIDVRTPFRPVAFPGEWPITSVLEQGGVGVLNLICDRAAARGHVAFPRPGEGLALKGGTHILYAPAGAVRFALAGDDLALNRDDALRVKGAAMIRHRSGVLAVASVEAQS